MDPQNPVDLKILQYKLFNKQRLSNDELESLPEVVRVLTELNDNLTDKLRTYSDLLGGMHLYDAIHKTWWTVTLEETTGLPILMRANKPK